MKRILIPALVVIVLGIGFLYWASSYLNKRESGHRHATLDSMEVEGIPNFSLPNLDGDEVSFSSLDAELYLINFWASWCAPCVEEFPSMIALMQELGGRAKLIAISADHSRDDMEAFLKAFEADKNEDLVLLWDQKREVANQFGTERLPETYLVNQDGKLIRKVAGTLDWMTPNVVSYMKSLLDSDTPVELPSSEVDPTQY